MSEYPVRFNSVAVSKQITVFPKKCDWITAAVTPVCLEDESASEMCSCGQYMELGGPVLWDQMEISICFTSFGALLCGFFPPFLTPLKSIIKFYLFISFYETAWLVAADLFKGRQSAAR